MSINNFVLSLKSNKMSTLDLRSKMEELKVLKLAYIRRGDFINAAMIRDRISFYNRQIHKHIVY